MGPQGPQLREGEGLQGSHMGRDEELIGGPFLRSCGPVRGGEMSASCANLIVHIVVDLRRCTVMTFSTNIAISNELKKTQLFIFVYLFIKTLSDIIEYLFIHLFIYSFIKISRYNLFISIINYYTVI